MGFLGVRSERASGAGVGDSPSFKGGEGGKREGITADTWSEVGGREQGECLADGQTP